MAEYVDPGFVDEGYVEGDAGATTLSLVFPGSADRRRGGTMLQAPGGLAIAHLPVTRAPSIIVALHNWQGLRLFSWGVLDDTFTANDIGRYPTLIGVDPVDLGGAPAGDILGRITVSERAVSRATFSNMDKFWSKMWAREAILSQPMGIFVWFGLGQAHGLFIGVVESLELSQYECTLEFGHAA